MFSKIRFIGYFLVSLAFLICFKMLNFEIDSLHRSLKNIRFSRLKRKDTTEAEVQEVLDLIEDAQPITGCGMFEITRSTLTSMVSTSLTYLIILIQFKLSF